MAAVAAIKYDDGADRTSTPSRTKSRTLSRELNEIAGRPPASSTKVSSPLPYQSQIKAYYESPATQGVAAVLIFSNFLVSAAHAQIASTMSHETSKHFDALEVFFAIIFAIELVWNIYGSWFFSFWKNAWNIFDFVIVLVSVMSLLLSNLPGIAVLRLFRAFRVFRLSRRIKSLRQIVEGVIASMPGVANAFVILVMLMGIWSIMGVEFFGESEEEYFGTFIKAMLTMWQVITLDAWSDVCRDLIFKHHKPLAAVFFVSFIFIAAIVMSNVVVAVLLDKFLAANATEKEAEAVPPESEQEDQFVNQALQNLLRSRALLPSSSLSIDEPGKPESVSVLTFAPPSGPTTPEKVQSPTTDLQREFLIRSIQELTATQILQASTTKQLLELVTTLDAIFQPREQLQPIAPSHPPSQPQPQPTEQTIEPPNRPSRVRE